MTDGDVMVTGSRAGWFFAGAFVVAAALGLFLYVDGYFSNNDTLELNTDVPRVVIEGQ